MRSTLLALVAAAAWATPLRAQDPASLADLAALLAAEDRREFDGGFLRRAVEHADPLVRQRAAMAIGRIGDRAGTPLLLRLLDDPDSTVAVEAVFALGELSDDAAVRALAARAARFGPAANSDVEVELVTALAKLGGPEADHALAEVLRRFAGTSLGGGTGDRAAATALLEAWRLGRRSAVAARLPAYVRNAGGVFRRNAVYSATRLRLPQAAMPLLDAASDPDPLTRSWVARGLLASVADSVGAGRETFVTRLRQLLADSSGQVRTSALRALASFADSTLASLAAARLVDRDPNVPVQAAATLGALGGGRAVEALAERFAGATSFALRRASLLGLAQAAPERAMRIAHAWHDDADWRLRMTYAEMLAVAATPAARAQLLEMAGDADGRVVAAALNGLAQATDPGDSAALAAAQRGLGHADPVVRAAALDLLGRERAPVHVRTLAAAYRRAEGDRENDARLAAARALAAIVAAQSAARASAEAALLGAFPRSGDYLVRRAVVEGFGEAAHRRWWGSVLPVETGRTPEEYRDVARRFVLRQAPPPPVTIETERGAIVLELHSADAPLTVDHFLRLVDRRFFDNGRWHRVVPNFVIQDGDPRGDGNGGPGTAIRDEVNRYRYDRAVLGMALSGPDTGGSQFFLTHSPQPHLDGGYTVFGHVIAGWDVLDQVVQGDRIRRIFR